MDTSAEDTGLNSRAHLAALTAMFQDEGRPMAHFEAHLYVARLWPQKQDSSSFDAVLAEAHEQAERQLGAKAALPIRHRAQGRTLREFWTIVCEEWEHLRKGWGDDHRR